MPEGVSGGQAFQNSEPKQTDATAAQEQHFQTLEQAISFFEKQDPEGFFGAPVTEDVAPNYFNVVKHPMSFQRMRQKLRALEYRTFAAFVEDFELVGNNAMRYNQKRSRVHRSAVNLLRHGKKHLNNVQLEATRAIHLLHPEGPVAAAQEEAAANRATTAATLAPSTSNLGKLLPSLSMPQHSSKQLQRGVSGLDMSMPMALQDLQADYFSEEDPAYSSFSDTDESDAEPSTPSFSTQAIPQPVVAEPWGNPAQPDASTSAPTNSSSLQPASSTVWQTHWLELRIHALKQQQQRYEAKLQRLQQKGRQPAQSDLPPLLADPKPLSGSAHDHVGGSGGTAEGISPQHQSAQPDACHPAASHSLTQLPTPDLNPHQSDAVPSTSAPLAVHQQAAAAHESRPKRRHARQQMPGLAMPEIARHPFFSQHAAAEPARSGGQQLASEEEGRDECYPARVHATLDLLDRHLATMKDQLTPKPAAGRAPPKKVARGGVAVARRGKAKPGRGRGLFAPPSKQVLDRSDSRLGSKRRRTTEYDFGDVIMPPLPGAKALAQLPKVCITVPGVRPLPEDELARRVQAVELIRSGTSQAVLKASRGPVSHLRASSADSPFTTWVLSAPLVVTTAQHVIPGQHDSHRAGVSEADSGQKGLVPLPSDGAGADAAGGNPASSSDEDTSDEAFAARHAVFEAEEQQRFNSFAGGGAQRSARSTAAGSKNKPPKPPVRMDSMPPPEAKLLNVAAAVLPPQSASVAMDPAAVLEAAAGPAAAPDAVQAPAAASRQVLEQLPRSDVEMADILQMGGENSPHDRLLSNGQAAPSYQQQDKGSHALPELGLTLLPNVSTVQADDSRSLSHIDSKASAKNGRKSSTPRGSTPRAAMGRPPRGGSGNMTRQESNINDKKDSRKLMRRNTTG